MLAWGFAFLIYNPEVEKKCHAELDRVFGSTDRVITLADKQLLPYCNATINVSIFELKIFLLMLGWEKCRFGVKMLEI